MFSKEQLQSILNGLPNRVLLISRSGRYLAAFGGPMAYDHYDRSRLIGKSIYDFVAQDKADFFLEQIERALRDNQLIAAEYELTRSDLGETYKHGWARTAFWLEGRIQPLPGLYDGEPAVLWEVNDITERHELEVQLRRLSDTDELTSLHNRRKLITALSTAFDDFQRYRCSTSIFLFDIDNFKKVNDAQGHQAGDDALKAVAEVCKREARKTDLIARLGGDEFIILMEHVDLDQAVQLADRLRMVIEKELATATSGTISGGVSAMLASDTSIDDVLKRADIALYEAKSQGRNRVQSL